nr:MAG TPA: hypothetical protein [Herelleviridae sp.]
MDTVSFFNYGLGTTKKNKLVRLLSDNRDNNTHTGEYFRNNTSISDDLYNLYEFDNKITNHSICNYWSDNFVIKDNSLTKLTESNYKITLDPQLSAKFGQSGYTSGFGGYEYLNNGNYTIVEEAQCIDNHQIYLKFIGISKNPNVTKVSELEFWTDYIHNVTIELEDPKEYYIYYMGYFTFVPFEQGSTEAEQNGCLGCGEVSLTFKKPEMTIEKL